MNYKKLLAHIAAGLLVFAVVVALIQGWGIPLRDIFAGIAVYTLFGLFIISYFLRFALIFFGVFAIYKILQDRYYKQNAV